MSMVSIAKVACVGALNAVSCQAYDSSIGMKNLFSKSYTKHTVDFSDGNYYIKFPKNYSYKRGKYQWNLARLLRQKYRRDNKTGNITVTELRVEVPFKGTKSGNSNLATLDKRDQLKMFYLAGLQLCQVFKGCKDCFNEQREHRRIDKMCKSCEDLKKREEEKAARLDKEYQEKVEQLMQKHGYIQEGNYLGWKSWDQEFHVTEWNWESMAPRAKFEFLELQVFLDRINYVLHGDRLYGRNEDECLCSPSKWRKKTHFQKMEFVRNHEKTTYGPRVETFEWRGSKNIFRYDICSEECLQLQNEIREAKRDKDRGLAYCWKMIEALDLIYVGDVNVKKVRFPLSYKDYTWRVEHRICEDEYTHLKELLGEGEKKKKEH